MIRYAPLWKMLLEKNATTYTLREKCKISHATVERLQKDLSVTTYTLDKLCKIFNCQLYDIAEYIPDEQV